jgi:hypothetical protein
MLVIREGAMTDTIKSLREDTDESLSRLKADLEGDIGRVDAETKSLRGELKQETSGLRDDLSATANAIAHIEGRIRGWSLVIIVGSIVATAVGAVGVTEFFKDRSELRQLIREQKSLNQLSAVVSQTLLVDKLEAEFDKNRPWTISASGVRAKMK